GEAVLLDAATTSPTPIRSVPFEGRGFKGVATADGRRAYLLSYHSGKGKARETAGAWIHEIDLVAGKEGASAALARLPNGLAVDPAGRRLFVSFQDEILTYTTRPLASSWRYRSPGVNRGLYVTPGGDLLYAVRERQVALFQLRPQAAPGADAARRSRDDDASAVVPLPIDAAALDFSPDGGLALAFGRGGRVAFVDLVAHRTVEAPAPPAALEAAELIRPILFPAAADLLVALFPSRAIVELPRPTPGAGSPPEPAPASSTPPAPAPEPLPAAGPTPAEPQPGRGMPLPPPAPNEEPSPVPLRRATSVPVTPRAGAVAVPEAPAPPPPRIPEPRATQAPVKIGKVLRGKLTGEVSLVTAVVVYGPDSLIREQARAVPSADGSWEIPLPPPGRYRIVPVGESGRSLRSEPNFHTLSVGSAEEGRDGLDFSIRGRS
ncbi:MAG TPA: hypothetical protein VFT43_11095, partial [Candidatus Polarisedimenticolia bacterium]|nr:hypothetical protein [Candidatus Polarisedimenticolia bacterium]